MIYFYFIIAQVPVVAQVTPLEISNQANKHSRGSLEFPKQNLRQIGNGPMSYDRTYNVKISAKDPANQSKTGKKTFYS